MAMKPRRRSSNAPVSSSSGEGLTGTDPESLALATHEKPELKRPCWPYRDPSERPTGINPPWPESHPCRRPDDRRWRDTKLDSRQEIDGDPRSETNGGRALADFASVVEP